MPNELSSMLDGFAIDDSQPPHQEFIARGMVFPDGAKQPAPYLLASARPQTAARLELVTASTGASEVEWFSNLLERAAQYGYRAS